MDEIVQCRCGHKYQIQPGWREITCKCGNAITNLKTLPNCSAPPPSPICSARPGSALEIQEGGGHYKDQPIQPVEYIHANGIGYFEGNVIKYVSRWRKKNGLEDLKKAKHYIELLIELEQKKEQA